MDCVPIKTGKTNPPVPLSAEFLTEGFMFFRFLGEPNCRVMVEPIAVG
jgi:hypothetical protein